MEEMTNTIESLLDVRRAADFERLHHIRAANIPVEELTERMHELGPPEAPIHIFDVEESRTRRAATLLADRGRIIAGVLDASLLAGGLTATGPSMVRLWRPHALLIEALSHIAASPPPSRVALDLACGSGRDAVWLAIEGWKVHAWDILPDALERCADLAMRNGVRVSTSCVDLEAGPDIPVAGFDMVCCFNFLHRPLLRVIANAVRPGGYLAYETFAKPQREMFGKPASDSHLLKTGELAAAFEGWNILVNRVGLTGPRRYASGVIARRPNE